MSETSHRVPLRAAIYTRISRDQQKNDEDKEGQGVQRQEEACRALAESLGWEVVGVYVDNDISAASGKLRPQFKAMLEAVKAGDVQGVVAWHPDRMIRRPTELEDFISLVEKSGLQVHTVTAGGYDLSNPSGQMVARMLGAAARYEVDQVRKRVLAKKADAAKKGEYRGGRRAFGYEADGMRIRAGEAAIILEATDAILAGRTLAGIARELGARGVTGARGLPITGHILHDMLVRPRNAGILAHGLPNRIDTTSRSSRPYEEVGPARWPAIVPEEKWRAVVAVLTDPSRRISPTSELRWLGSGIYRCGVPVKDDDGNVVVDKTGEPVRCGGVLRVKPHGTSTRTGERRASYRCVASAHLTIDQRPTDAHVLEVLAEAVRDPRVREAMDPGRAAALERDRAQRLALTGRLSRFEDDYTKGKINGGQLKRATETVEAEIAQIDERTAKSLGQWASSSILSAADPGAALLAAPIDVQRAVLSSVIRVEVRPAPHGGVWSSDRLMITRPE